MANRNEPTWDAAYTVRIPLPQAYHHGGGRLCVEIEGAPVTGAASRFWPVDADRRFAVGQTTSVDIGCHRWAVASATAGDALAPGGTLRLVGQGDPGCIAVLALGSLRASGIDLAFLGALATMYSSPAEGPGIVNLAVHLPAELALAGVRLGAQWLSFPSAANPARLTTSNAMLLQLASTVPAPSSAVVRTGVVQAARPLPVRGAVDPFRAPIVGFVLE